MKFAIVFSREVLWAVADSLEEVVPMNYPYERSLVREYLPSLALGMFLVALLTFIFTFLG